MKALITRKLGMTSAIGNDGALQAVTLLLVAPNTVTQLKSIERDGYQAVQLGAEESNKLPKPQTGHYKAAKVQPKVAREVRVDELPEDVKLGDRLTADVFSVGDTVHVTGISKGKGWAGTVKRHNFHRGRKTHGGQSYRRPGSIGSMYPQKIFKGKKMAGRMGHEQTTIRNLSVVMVDNERNIIGVTGAVPGPNKGLVLVREATK